MTDIFISYARKNATFVERLRDDLKADGFDYWIDTEGLAAGTTSWEKAIRQAIQDCTPVIWVVSPASYESPYVKDEISIARMKGRKIYPIWADGDNWLECVPLGTGEIQFVDMRETKYKAGLEELRKALGGKRPELIAKTEEATRLPVGVESRNPYKGLHAFMEKDAGDFFGRSNLINQLCQVLEKRLAPEQNRFLAVLGPSGAGKSSVVMAGLIPALQNGALKNSKNWTYLPRIVPGKYPLEALTDALHSHLREIPLSTLETDLKAGVRYFPRHLKRLEGEHVLLYIDQFEELFSLTEDEAERQQFIDLLVTASTDPDSKLIIVLSMRADFYGHPMHYPQLGALITAHQSSVLPMTITELYETIQKPALLPDVSLRFDEGLVADIVFELRERNVALEGALPFLEFTLARLFEAREGNQLKRHAYEMMGGVAGAIGHHAESLFSKLSTEAQASFTKVFLPLTNIHPDTGEATRKRAKQGDVIRDDASQKLVKSLIDGRLLTTGRAEDGEIYIEVAHEALFRSWERLKNWKNITQQDLRDLQQVEREARDWDRKGRTFLPSAERLQPLYQAVERLELQGRLNPILQDFLYPQAMLLKELENPATSEQRRLRIGDDLALLGDPRPGVGLKEGVPDILWLPVAGTNSEKVEFETDGGSIGHFEVTPFYIARYQVTDGQYQAFVTAEDGYNNKMWWHDFPEQYQPQRLNEQRTKFINNPRDSISWYQAVAFGRWMTHRCKGLALPNPYNPTERYVIGENAEIRIPTEWEWQWAAQNGAEKRQYPWGEWQRGYTDTSESGLGRPIAVGMYPHGAAVCGALDMAGNLWEWCMNKKDTPEFTAADTSGDSRVLRGGSFSYSQNLARSVYRYYYNPYNVFNYYGFRVVFAPILRL